jgi:hypothetical protein
MLVLAITVLMMISGGILVETSISTNPLVQTDAVQRYSYRALQSGIDTLLNDLNANPNLVTCNSTLNGTGACGAISFNTWSPVTGTVTVTGTGASATRQFIAGVVPEYYLFGNPQPQNVGGNFQQLQVQVVGAAGYPGHVVYQSMTTNLDPANGFLNNVWWSDYEAYDPTGSYTGCTWDWANNYNGPGGTCLPVYFGPSDTVIGPVYSNDSIYVDGNPHFGTTSNPSAVQTEDPNCQFVDPSQTDANGNFEGSPPGCGSIPPVYSSSTGTFSNNPVGPTEVGVYLPADGTAATSMFNHPRENLPQSDTQLQGLAMENGCYYQGPTTIHLSVTTSGAGQMTVSSPETPTKTVGGVKYSTNAAGTTNNAANSNLCPVSGTGPLPANGVVYVDSLSSTLPVIAGTNPFDDTANGGTYAQTKPSGCTDASASVTTYCYLGASDSPDTEGDAFVYGTLSGQLTIGANTDVIIDGSITYHDCTWGTVSNGTYTSGTASESACLYNPSSFNTSTMNDSLGLIANEYVLVNHPVDMTGAYWYGTPLLPDCGATGALPRPLCDPANPASGSITIDATILALTRSFAVNNHDVNCYDTYNSNYGFVNSCGYGTYYGTYTTDNKIIVYGSIQQKYRGAVGTFNVKGGLASGFSKYYTYDPRLQLVPPPHYLNPGTPSWVLGSSSATISDSCPNLVDAWQAYSTSAQGTTTCTPPTIP